MAIAYQSHSASPGSKEGLRAHALWKAVVQEMPVEDPVRPRILGFVSTVGTILGDYETAALVCKEALKINPEDRVAMISYVISLWSNHEYEAIADWLSALARVNSMRTGETALMDFLTIGVGGLELYTLLGLVLRQSGKIDWAHQIFRQALSVAERSRDPMVIDNVRFHLAAFLLQQTDSSAESLMLLEGNLERVTDIWFKNGNLELLSEVYFDEASHAF